MITRQAGGRRLLGVLAGLLLAAGAGPLAAPARAATSLEVSAGHGGFHVPGRAVPVRVTVSADRLVHGDLVVLAPGRREPVTVLPVEVAGGSVKQFLLVVPGGVAGTHGTLAVELRGDGRTVRTAKTQLRPAEDAELVGLGPGLAGGRPLPGTVPLAVDAGVARFTEIDASLLAAPGALDGLSTVGLAADELAALPPSARTGLLRWVSSGGHLLLDDDPGAGIEGLPADWQPGPAGRAGAGRGEVRLTAGAMAAGSWAGLVEPTALSLPDNFEGFPADGVADSLAGDAGLRLPRLATLLGFLGAYVLVAGPVTAFVLRRRRRPELAWVVVPVLAVIFTGLAWTGGNQLRPGTGVAHATVLETDARGANATSWVGFTRRRAGIAEVGLPAGWLAEPTLRRNLGGLPTTAPGDAGDSTQARLPVASGEFGLLKASGPVASPGRLEVNASARVGGEEVRGRVRNRMPFPLHEVVVFAGGRRVRVGELAPGEEREWTANAGDRFFDLSGWDLWGERFGPTGSEGPVNPALWQSMVTGEIVDERVVTGVTAVGWTRDWQPELTLDGRERHTPGRTAVIGRAPVSTADGRVAAPAVRREVVRGPFPSLFRGFDMGSGEPTVVKFTLPAGVDAADRPLVVKSSFAASRMEVWRDGAWEPVGGFAEGVAIFEDGRAVIRRGINFGRDVRPLIPVPTTVAVPVPRLAPVPAPPKGIPVPPEPSVPPPPVGPDPAGAGAGDAFEIPLPEGSAAGGVVFLRFTFDPSMMSPDGILTLEEAS